MTEQRDFEGCCCGIIFERPLSLNSDYWTHFTNHQHYEAFKIKVCAPCEFGACKNCIKGRHDGEWKCTCEHLFPTERPSDQELMRMYFVFSEWLRAGCKSEQSLAS